VTHKPFKRFIGIDLGGGKGKKTALAVLERSKGGVTVTALHPRADEPPLYDAALIAAVRGALEPRPFVHCLWEGGSTCFARADQWSDVDLQCEVDDDQVGATFAAVVMLVYGLLQFFSKGMKTYEERYVAGATRTLDAMAKHYACLCAESAAVAARKIRTRTFFIFSSFS